MTEFDESLGFGAEGFTLRCDSGSEQPVLTGVEASGRLDGVLFTLTLRQTYRNPGQRKLEVVYSFPLPAKAVLLGFAAELEGKRLAGRILPRHAAEQEYEKAQADGDAPVMLEAAGDGLHTANIGNLQAGETLVLEIRIAQLLVFVQGRLRVAVPTTIAPRHGNPAAGGLLPHQVPESSLVVDYPVSLHLDVMGSLADAEIYCPSHAHRMSSVEGGRRLQLAPGATLDRDLVFIVTPRQPRAGFLIQAADAVSARSGAGTVALAAFQLPPGRARPPARLKLLVDCSGSMGGDSIASARRALNGVIDGLRPADAVSFSRFGSTTRLVMSLRPLTADVIETLRRHVAETEADLGGTEMAGALMSLIGKPGSEGRRPEADDGADILLITDGEVWDTEKVVAAARRTGHRVFVIGVGSSPAEGVLTRLAEATGGACEFATPGEKLEAAALRMLARMRRTAWSGLRVDWGAQPRWQLDLPHGAHGGDTLITVAGFGDGAAPTSVARLVADSGGPSPTELATATAEAGGNGDDLPRLAASRRLPSLDADAARELALDYALLCEHTHCVLVHQRADADKQDGEAELHRVRSMLAAGWGGTGSVMADSLCISTSAAHGHVQSSVTPTRILRSMRSAAPQAVSMLMEETSGWFTATHALKRRADGGGSEPTLSDIAAIVIKHLADGLPREDLASRFAGLAIHPHLGEALTELRALVADEALVWMVLAGWVLRRDGHASQATTLMLVAIQDSLIRELGADLVDSAGRALDGLLGPIANGAWQSARQRRLRRQLQVP